MVQSSVCVCVCVYERERERVNTVCPLNVVHGQCTMLLFINIQLNTQISLCKPCYLH